ncbi:flagellar hook-length control protein FliK [Treponema sp.]|uniref:flagellar hook-length control protein FliK n=1 Tax=Treponema sp. TaxID=166 RepID=UPI00298D66B5|nr:flagellar hook-length control protein FliK [Treponema sp.]MCQ2241995.1 flagellar hook-length control protein FliK [Treponema sp.]
MQALNLQLLETQNSKNQPKNFSSLKNEPKSGMSFRDMVKSMSKNDFEKKTVRYENRSQEVSEPAKADQPEAKVENRPAAPENPKNKYTRNENEKIASRNEFETSENMEVENAENNIKAVSVEAIPADFIVNKEIISKAEITASEELPEEAVVVNEAEFSFLKTKAPSNDDPLAIIENAVEYESKNDLVINAQNLSVENPEKFLDGREIANENSEASELSVAAFGNLEQRIDAINMNDAKKDETAFTLEVADSSSSVKSEATSLFEEIFTVTDNRSVEEKIAQFKSMINENAESSSENNINLALSMSDNAAQNILSTNNQTAGATGSTFQEMLTQQIQTNVPDFVKAGNIVLRDNNQGSINMILKPEALGNVKINLQVADNVITGQITVHSKEAFEAFKQNMDSLRQAFQESGFENANLNLSFADNSSSGAFAQQGERQQSGEQFFGNKTYSNYAASADSDDYSAETVSYESGLDKQVSIVA